MGRQGPKLVPFLQNALMIGKYKNLILEDSLGLQFSIVLPHKTKKLTMEDELILKDWYVLNKKRYVFASKHYTDAKQAMTASLRKSDYVEKVHVNNDKLTYRILSKGEVKDKKKLKKELKEKNKLKNEAMDSDDVVSSEESGYGSGSDSPLIDYALIPMKEEVITSNAEDLLQTGYIMEADCLLEMNNNLQNTCSSEFIELLKSENMDEDTLDANALAAPGHLTDIQYFNDNLKPSDFCPEITESLTRWDLSDCYFDTSELNNSSFINELSIGNGSGYSLLDNFSNGDINNELLKDFPTFDFYPPVVNEDSTNSQLAEIQNIDKPPMKQEDILTDKLFKELMEGASTIDSHLSRACEENSQEQISPGTDFFDHQIEIRKNIYYCKKCVFLGRTPILLCEFQFENNLTKTSSEIKIAFDEGVLKEINGFKSVKEYKFIDNHLMVFLEPNDD